MNEKRVTIIAGPTGCGKSAMAADIAAEKGVVINADSMQLYQDLTILTARPDPNLLEKAPHKLYGILKGDAVCSVAQWRNLAIKEICETLEQNLHPIVVGGTGLYLQALTQGLSTIPPIQAQVREELARKQSDDLYTMLQQEDPLMAERLHPNDQYRIIRALEVMRSTGHSLKYWQTQGRDRKDEFKFTKLLILPDREELYTIANKRFDQMIADGAVAEVEALLSKNYPSSSPIFKAIGVQELSAYLKRKISLDEAVAQAKTSTRQYIKRQYTWFRWQFEADFSLSRPYQIQDLEQIQEFLTFWTNDSLVPY